MRLIVTRPRQQSTLWLAELAQRGVAAAALPLIEIGDSADVQALARAWRDIEDFSLVMFVSANAVQRFFAARCAAAGATTIAARGLCTAWPPHIRAASTGPGTTAALRAAGIAPTHIVEPDRAAGRFDSEALWQALANDPWQGAQVLVVRGDEGRDWLADRWRERGAVVRFVSAYCRMLPHWSEEETRLCDEAIAQPQWHVWLFSSSEAVRNLAQLRPGAPWRESQALASHERVAQTALQIGFARLHTVAPDAGAIAAAVARIAQDRSVQSAPL